MLTITNLSTHYGAIQALENVSLNVGKGEIVTLIGANGAGKTTLMMTLCGTPRASTGAITLEGEDITALPTEEIIRRGIALAPEGRRIFPRLSILENLQIGASHCDKKYFASDLEKITTLFPRLKERMTQQGGTLSGGEQQMLAIGRALMSRPKLLLLDEPSLGLAPLVVKSIFTTLRDISATEKLTLFLVEQNAHIALRFANRGYVLVNGRITLSGTGTELLNNPEVRSAYLEGETAA
ncbi:MAG: ABC transporter ATP-binding protein [Alphaproteobacteria bacterium]|nr:ABC transporter ATP-binding protein [Alphaproteobacteria bacterium]MBV8548843.1 ABC transporter ATP-binding protein [Alphaproteobacteria bacterium]